MQIAERFEQLVDTVRGRRGLESRVEKLAQRIRATHAVPLRLRLWNGRSYELGPDPTVTLTVRLRHTSDDDESSRGGGDDGALCRL